MNPVAKSNIGTVAVTVPLSDRAELTPDELVSLRHLTHFLGHYDKYLLAPKGLVIDIPGFQVERFGKRYFGSPQAHNQMCLAAELYERFRKYKYILMYHLDALVLSDQLMQWCETDLDYIGAPWIRCDDTPWVKRERVGNGGFSLIKIESFLKACHSQKVRGDPDKYWERYCDTHPKYLQYLNWPRKYLKRLPRFNGARGEMAKWHLHANSDFFWSDRASFYLPEFKVASVETGLRFAFEAAPRLCFERNHRRLPFGCHGWPRWDRSFWEPHLLPA